LRFYESKKFFTRAGIRFIGCSATQNYDSDDDGDSDDSHGEEIKQMCPEN
jgi:hypothetical protein